MSSRIQTAFPKDEPLPENIFSDLNWVSENRLELYKKYGSCVVIVYHKEIIGMGKTRQEALNDAEIHLADDVELITPAIGLVSNPYRVDRFYLRQIEE
jgi:hypothetical protein